MARMKEVPITDQDMMDFVTNDSDFAFEMKVVTELRALEFECLHAGTYQDPISNKVRQFDIRARKISPWGKLALAVECKNLRSNYPLLLSAVPRTGDEAFHDLLVHEQRFGAMKVDQKFEAQSAYKANEMVGKKTDQVGRDTSDKLTSEDNATFERLNQAINSCKDLIQGFVHDSGQPLVRAVVPVLVVPDGLLWQVDYSSDGRLVNPPRTVTSATLFLNHEWSVDSPWHPVRYRLSHIELVTLDALPETVSRWLGKSGFFAAFQT